MEYKLSDILKVRLKERGLDSLTFSSVLWKSICEIFLEEKNIDIENYLISISHNKNTIFIKTNKPIINAQLLELETKFLDRFKDKMQNLSASSEDFNFDIKYL